jgi:hypothetical protein
VALGDGLLDKLAARAAGCPENEEFHAMLSLDFPDREGFMSGWLQVVSYVQ